MHKGRRTTWSAVRLTSSGRTPGPSLAQPGKKSGLALWGTWSQGTSWLSSCKAPSSPCQVGGCRSLGWQEITAVQYQSHVTHEPQASDAEDGSSDGVATAATAYQESAPTPWVCGEPLSGRPPREACECHPPRRSCNDGFDIEPRVPSPTTPFLETQTFDLHAEMQNRRPELRGTGFRSSPQSTGRFVPCPCARSILSRAREGSLGSLGAVDDVTTALGPDTRPSSSLFCPSTKAQDPTVCYPAPRGIPWREHPACGVATRPHGSSYRTPTATPARSRRSLARGRSAAYFRPRNPRRS